MYCIMYKVQLPLLYGVKETQSSVKYFFFFFLLKYCLDKRNFYLNGHSISKIEEKISYKIGRQFKEWHGGL